MIIKTYNKNGGLHIILHHFKEMGIYSSFLRGLIKLNISNIKLIMQIYNLISAKTNGFYLVGGIVRDSVMGNKTNDIDITINTPFFNMQLIRDILVENYPNNKVIYFDEFNNIKMKYNKITIDIVPFRKEKHTNYSHKPSIESGTFIDDLLRRDFTINSMYLKINSDNNHIFIDPLNGKKDIQDKLLRIIYPESFIDDPTRMMRLIIYKHRLGFNIEKNTLNLINSIYMRKVNHYALITMLLKIIAEEKASLIINDLIDFHLLDNLGITAYCQINDDDSNDDKLFSILKQHPNTIKIFKDLNIYCKMLKKI